MSNSFSKPITSYSLYFQMPVRKYVSNDMDYDDFCQRFMKRRTLPPMNETDDEFEKRCEKAWKDVFDAQKRKGYHEFPEVEVDEDDEGEADEELQDAITDYTYQLIETGEDIQYANLEENERRRQTEEKTQRVKDAREVIEKQRLEMEKQKRVMDFLQQQFDKLLMSE